MATVDERLRMMALAIERGRAMVTMVEGYHQSNQMDALLLGLRRDVIEIVAAIHGVKQHDIPSPDGPEGFWSKESVMAYTQPEVASNVQAGA